MSATAPAESIGHFPRHIAIIMDGNGRWAKRRGLPRSAGHRAGVRAARDAVEWCGANGIGALSLFAFSSENWNRPRREVSLLMSLFVEALEKEIDALNRNNVRLRFVGDRLRLAAGLRDSLEAGERVTAANTGLSLNIAMAYGGRWDLAVAARSLAQKVADGDLQPDAIDEAMLGDALCLADLPEPDLLIRTGGEHRLSNFLIWQLAYSELYFSDVFWPDFDAENLSGAVSAFGERQRRYGLTGDQVSAG